MIVGLKGTKGWAEVQRGSVGATLTEGAIKQQRILLTATKKIPDNAWEQLEKNGRILMRIT